MNFGLFLTLVFGKAVQRIFFGRLRAVEVEVSALVECGAEVASLRARQDALLTPFIHRLARSTYTNAHGTPSPQACWP